MPYSKHIGKVFCLYGFKKMPNNVKFQIQERSCGAVTRPSSVPASRETASEKEEQFSQASFSIWKTFSVIRMCKLIIF